MKEIKPSVGKQANDNRFSKTRQELIQFLEQHPEIWPQTYNCRVDDTFEMQTIMQENYLDYWKRASSVMSERSLSNYLWFFKFEASFHQKEVELNRQNIKVVQDNESVL